MTVALCHHSTVCLFKVSYQIARWTIQIPALTILCCHMTYNYWCCRYDWF